MDEFGERRTSRRKVLAAAGLAAVLVELKGSMGVAAAAAAAAPAPTAAGVSVLDFGAAGDGYTDDTAAFAQAIASLPNGGRVNVPEGIYSVSQIRLTRRIEMVGHGWRSIIAQRPGTVGGLVVLANSSVEFTRVASLMLNGNRDQQTTPNACIDYNNDGGTFSFYDANHVLDNLLLYRPAGNGLTLSLACRETKVTTVYAMAAGGYGFSIGCTDSVFTSSTSGGSGQSGWYLWGPNNKIASCKSFGSGRATAPSDDSGFYLAQGRQLMTACESQDNGGHGFLIKSSDNSLAACVADSNGSNQVNTSGFRLEQALAITLSGYVALNRTGKSFQKYGLDIADASTSVTAIGSSHDHTLGDLAGTTRHRYIVINGERQAFSLPASPTVGAGDLGEIVFNSAPAAGSAVAWVCVAAGSPGSWQPIQLDGDSAIAVLPPPAGGDDAPAINTVLQQAAGRCVRGRAGSAYVIGRPLVVPARTTLDMTGCTITLRPGANCNMVQNPAVAGSVRSISACQTQPGSAVIDAADSAFGLADIGRTVLVPGAGVAGGNLSAVIVAVAGTTRVTLDTPASLQGTFPATVFDRDPGVGVVGGIWDRGANLGSGRDAHSIVLRRCDDASVSHVTLLGTQGRYLVDAGDVRGLSVQDVTVTSPGDGVHVHGPADRVVVDDVAGTVAADGVAVFALDPAPFNDVGGAIGSVRISRVAVQSAGGALVHLHTGPGLVVDDVSLTALSGTARRGVWASESAPATGTFNRIRMDGVSVTLPNLSYAAAVDVSVGAGGQVTIRNLTFGCPAFSVGVLLGSWSACEIGGLTNVAGGGTTIGVRVLNRVRLLSLRDVSLTFADTNLSTMVDVPAGAQLGTLTIANAVQTKGRCALSLSGPAAAVELNRVSVTGAARLLNVTAPAGAVTLRSTNTSGLLAAAIYVASTGTITIAGTDWQTDDPTHTGVQRQGGSAPACTLETLPVDLLQVARSRGGAAWNVNATLACGVGTVRCDGALWHNLFTGKTY